MSQPRIHSVSCHGDESLFVLATDIGAIACNTDPYLPKPIGPRRGIVLASVRKRSNIVALVGGGKNAFDATNRVILYDVQTELQLAQIEFREAVLAVTFAGDHLICALRSQVRVFRLHPNDICQFVCDVETCENPRGLMAVTETGRLACPSARPGHVQVLDIPSTPDASHFNNFARLQAPTSSDTQPSSIAAPDTASAAAGDNSAQAGSRKKSRRNSKGKRRGYSTVFSAHTRSLAAMACDASGERLATCSTKGTIVRVFEAKTGVLLASFRRGFTPVDVRCLRFSKDGRLLAATSSTSVHLFRIDDAQGHGRDGSATTTTSRSSRKTASAPPAQSTRDGTGGRAADEPTDDGMVAGWARLLQNQLDSTPDRSFASISVQAPPSLVVFGSDSRSLVVVSLNGTYFRYEFDQLGVAEERTQFLRLLKPDLSLLGNSANQDQQQP